jgi:hypothetical protein
MLFTANNQEAYISVLHLELHEEFVFHSVPLPFSVEITGTERLQHSRVCVQFCV